MPRGPVFPMDDGAAIAVWAVAGASASEVGGLHGDRIRVRVACPPEEGRANAEITRLLHEKIGVEPRLRRGIRSRAKLFVIPGVDVETVRRKLNL